MRLIGFGLLAFLLAATGLFLSNSGTLQTGIRAVGEVFTGPSLVFETDAETRTPRKGTAEVRRAGPQTPIILSGFPAYAGATFFMPIDAQPTAGYLEIDTTVQLLDDAEGVLRISINGTKRGELLLRPGESSRSLRVQLTEQEIAQEQLVVSFSLQGEGPNLACAADEGIEAIVEIETTSAIHLELDGTLSDDIDTALAGGRAIQLAWSAATDPATSLMAARALSTAGLEPGFSSTGITPAAAFDLAERFARPLPEKQFAWDGETGPDSDLVGLETFERNHTWRIRYDMMDATDQRLPGQINLEMRLGPQVDAEQWQVVVTLNGRHVHGVLADQGLYTATIGLPERYHQRQNVIEITVSSTRFSPDACAQGVDLFAEVLDGTRLVASTEPYESSLTQLFSQLDAGWILTVDGNLSQAEAAAAVEMLTQLPEPGDENSAPVLVRVLPRGTDLSSWTETSTFWLITLGTDGDPVAMPVSDVTTRTTGGVSLLVDLTGAAT